MTARRDAEGEPASAEAGRNEPGTRDDPAMQAGLLVLGTTLATLASALTPLLIVRLLGKADVSRLLSVTLVYETLAGLLCTGFPYTLLYHASNRDWPTRAAVARRVLCITAALGAAGALLVALIVNAAELLPATLSPSQDTRLQGQLIAVLSLALIADLPSRILPNLMVVERQAGRSAAIQVLRTLLVTTSLLVPLALGQSVAVVIVCHAIARGCFGLLVLYELRRLYGGAERVPCPDSVKHLFRFALPIGATDAFGVLNAQLDRWLVLLVLPLGALAEYQAGAWQVPVLGTIAYSVGAAYTPELIKHFQALEPERAIAVWRRSIEKVALLVVPPTMALVVGARELMTVVFTADYVAAAPIFQVFSVMTFLRVAAFGSMIVAAGKPRYVLAAAVAGFALNALFSVPLVLTIGYLGPALGTSLAFVLQVGIYVYFIARAARVPFGSVFPLRAYLRILALAAVAGLAGYLVKELLRETPLLALPCEIAVVLVVFVLLGTASGTIERTDLAYARDWLRLKFARG